MRIPLSRSRVLTKVLYMFLCFTLAIPVPILNSVAMAATTDTKIIHKSPGSYIPGFRIKLKAKIEDSRGVKLARCYFKTKRDKNFSFVDMKPIGEGEYQAILPAPWINSQEVDYVFLVVNNDKKVVRSQVFKMKEEQLKGLKEWKGYGKVKMVRLDKIQEAIEEYEAFRKLLLAAYKDRLPDYQLVSNAGTIQVKTEIDPSQVELNGIYDSVVVQEVPMSMKYGFLVNGLYTPEAIAAAGGVSAAAQATGATGAGVVTASSGGISAGWIALGALVAGGAAGGIAAASGGGGGGDDHHDNDHVGSSGGGGGSTGGTSSTGRLIATAKPPNGHMKKPYMIEIINSSHTKMNMDLYYNGSYLGNYNGTSNKGFPLSRVGGDVKVVLKSPVNNGCVIFHFSNEGGRWPSPYQCYSFSGNPGDYFLLQTK